MKTLKIGILALFMAFGNLVWAQQPASQNQNASKTPEERATMHSKKLTQQLSLTADQEKSVYNYALQQAQQQDADRAKFNGDREGMRNARKQSMQTFETNVGQVLTADQKTKYEQLKQEEKEKRQNGGQRGGE
jgi:protein CpxP